MEKLFGENIEDYDLLQLEDWIRRCRTFVKKEDYISNNRSTENYKEAVLDFIEEWQNHYENEDNIKVYEKEDFKKAILGNGINLDRIVLAMNNGKRERRIDITEKLYNSFLKDEDIGVFQNLMTNYKEKRLEKIDNYFELISDLDYIDDYKEKIVELIRNRVKYEVLSYTTTVEDEEIFNIVDIEDLFDALMDGIEQIDKEFEVLEESYPFVSTIESFDITRQVFYDFEKESQDEVSVKEFSKKFFVNIGIYLSLNFDLFEMFLNLFGYTIGESRVERDRLLTEFIDLGLDKEYIDISIEALDLRPLTPRIASYRKKDLTLIEEFLGKSSYSVEEIKEFKFTVQYAITRLRTFINHKEEIIKRATKKYDKVNERFSIEKDKFLKISNELEVHEFSYYEDEEEYKEEISKKRQEIYVLKNDIHLTDEEKLQSKNDIKSLKKKEKELNNLYNEIRAKNKTLKQSEQEQRRIFDRAEISLNNAVSKLDRLKSEKYKSIDVFNENLEQYNNLNMKDLKKLLIEFEELYEKDF